MLSDQLIDERDTSPAAERGRMIGKKIERRAAKRWRRLHYGGEEDA